MEKQEKASFPSVCLYEINSWILLFLKSFNRDWLMLSLYTERFALMHNTDLIFS